MTHLRCRCTVGHCDRTGLVEMRMVEEPDEVFTMCNGHADWHEDQGLAVEVGSDDETNLLEDVK